MTKVTGIVSGEFVDDTSVIVPLCVPPASPADATLTVSDPGVAPDPGLTESQGLSVVAVQLIRPPAVSESATACDGGSAAPWTMLKLRVLGAACSTGAPTFSVTGIVRGEFVAPVAVIVIVAG